MALTVGQVRWRKSGGVCTELYDLSIYVIPAGIIGGRIYHVITTPELYFGVHGRFINAFKIWKGGMGIWGAVALGALVAYLYFRRRSRSISFSVALDALAPGILIAQAIGRWGNWFNHELFGSPTTVPWALRIPLPDRPLGYEKFATFHPTFLYESFWCLICAIAILFIPGVRKLRSGNVFILYIFLYCMGRVWIEAFELMMRTTYLGYVSTSGLPLPVLLVHLLFCSTAKGANGKNSLYWVLYVNDTGRRFTAK